LYRILSSYWLAHFYLLKKSAKGLHYFGLDCGILLTSRNPAFLEHGSAEKIAVCTHTNRDLNKQEVGFIYE
jgi:hypothetical protein